MLSSYKNIETEIMSNIHDLLILEHFMVMHLKTVFDFSIEEAKQKREHEKMLKTAEDKKVKVRKTIATLRSKFKKLKVVNKDLPKHLALVAQVSVVSVM